MRTSKKIPAYRDGYVSFVRPLSSNISSFGAPKNTRSGEDTNKVVLLAYDRMNVRQRDLEWAYANDKTLSLKIRCPFHPAVTVNMQAIIEDTLYDVYQLDPDVNNNRMFVYLQENRKL